MLLAKVPIRERWKLPLHDNRWMLVTRIAAFISGAEEQGTCEGCFLGPHPESSLASSWSTARRNLRVLHKFVWPRGGSRVLCAPKTRSRVHIASRTRCAGETVVATNNTKEMPSLCGTVPPERVVFLIARAASIDLNSGGAQPLGAQGGAQILAQPDQLFGITWSQLGCGFVRHQGWEVARLWHRCRPLSAVGLFGLDWATIFFLRFPQIHQSCRLIQVIQFFIHHRLEQGSRSPRPGPVNSIFGTILATFVYELRGFGSTPASDGQSGTILVSVTPARLSSFLIVYSQPSHLALHHTFHTCANRWWHTEKVPHRRLSSAPSPGTVCCSSWLVSVLRIWFHSNYHQMEWHIVQITWHSKSSSITKGSSSA